MRQTRDGADPRRSGYEGRRGSAKLQQTIRVLWLKGQMSTRTAHRGTREEPGPYMIARRRDKSTIIINMQNIMNRYIICQCLISKCW